MSTPKKYIDLADTITERLDVPCGNIRLGIHEALAYLDRYPDQAPGRTITESDYSDIAEWARNYSNRGWEGRTVLAGVGISIVPDPDPDPDPEPTNAESISKLLAEFAELNASCGGEQGDHDLAEFLNARGVKAGGDDE